MRSKQQPTLIANPMTSAPLLEKIHPMGPKEWITRLLLDPSITSSYYEPEYQNSAGTLLHHENDEQHLSVASSDKEHDKLISDDKVDDSEDVTVRPFIPRIKAYLAFVAKKVFVETYEFDGLHLSDASFTDADGEKKHFSNDELPLSMVIWTLLGFPNRPQTVTFLAETINFGLTHNFATILKNMFGSSFHPQINMIRKIPSRSRILVLLGLIVEILIIKPIIFLIKFAEVFFKIPLNALKFVIEYIPSYLKNVSGTLVGYLAKLLVLSTELYERSIWFTIGGYLAFGSAMIVMIPIHAAARLTSIVAAALLAPLKSAKFAWALATALVISRNIYLNILTKLIVGAIFLTVSVALSSALWAIVFPLVFTGLTALFPSLIGVINGIVATPLVASSLTAINAAIASAWSYLGFTAAFAYVSNALALHLGIQIAASTLATGVAAGLVAAPTAITAGKIAEAFSNGWARLNKTSFRSAFFPLFFRSETGSDMNDYRPIGYDPDDPKYATADEFNPSFEPSELVGRHQQDQHSAYYASGIADRFASMPTQQHVDYNSATGMLTLDGNNFSFSTLLDYIEKNKRPCLCIQDDSSSISFTVLFPNKSYYDVSFNKNTGNQIKAVPTPQKKSQDRMDATQTQTLGTW